MILLDGYISHNNFIKIDFFSYASFRKRFIKGLLDLLENELVKDSFRKIKNNINNNFVTFICPKCKVKENIPFYIVDMMNKHDNGDPNCPPRFNCQNCDGLMIPVYYNKL